MLGMAHNWAGRGEKTCKVCTTQGDWGAVRGRFSGYLRGLGCFSGKPCWSCFGSLACVCARVCFCSDFGVVAILGMLWLLVIGLS